MDGLFSLNDNLLKDVQKDFFFELITHLLSVITDLGISVETSSKQLRSLGCFNCIQCKSIATININDLYT